MAAASYYSSYNTSVAENAGLSKTLSELEGNLTGVQGSYARLLGRVVLVTVYIDYGNGTVARYENVTVSRFRPTAFLALLSVADAEFQVSDFGIFVTGIDGVRQSMEASKYWLYYAYEEGKGWVSPPVGADGYSLANGASISWNFTKISF